MAKKTAKKPKAPSFDFGFNVLPKSQKPKASKRRGRRGGRQSFGS